MAGPAESTSDPPEKSSHWEGPLQPSRDVVLQQLNLAAKTLSLALTAPTNRHDTKQLYPAEARAFFKALDDVVVQCTNANMTKFRAWALQNIAPRKDLLERLIAYLITYAKSLGGLLSWKDHPDLSRTAAMVQKLGRNILLTASFIENKNPWDSSVKRHKLNLFFLINDMLLAKHKGSKKHLKNIIDALYPRLPEFIQLVSMDEDNCSLEDPAALSREYDTTGTFAIDEKNGDHWHCHFMILRSLQMWYDKKLFSRAYLVFLKKVAMESAKIPIDTVGALADNGKEINVALPHLHGHPDNYFYQQPATALLRAKATETSLTIDQKRVAGTLSRHKALEPANAEAVGAVEELVALNKERRIKPKKKVKPVKKVVDKTPNKKFANPNVMDHDEMGRRVVKLEYGVTGVGKTYFGWSQAYCEQANQTMDQDEVGDFDDDY